LITVMCKFLSKLNKKVGLFACLEKVIDRTYGYFSKSGKKVAKPYRIEKKWQICAIKFFRL